MEDNIRNLNIQETIIANMVNVVFIILSIFCFFWGIRVVNGFDTPEMRLFGLLGFLIIFMRYLSFKFVIVYNAKDNGLIRFG